MDHLGPLQAGERRLEPPRIGSPVGTDEQHGPRVGAGRVERELQVVAPHRDDPVDDGVADGDVGAAIRGVLVDDEHLDAGDELVGDRVEAVGDGVDVVARHDHDPPPRCNVAPLRHARPPIRDTTGGR